MKSNLNTSRCGGFLRNISIFWLMTAIIVFAGTVNAADQENDAFTKTLGSGEQYKTTVDTVTCGNLSQEDFRQVTALGSRVLQHLNGAVENLLEDKIDKARADIEYAQKLAGIIRDLLPSTSVHTQVQDAKGHSVYDYTEIVQDDRIPIYESTLKIEPESPGNRAILKVGAFWGVVRGLLRSV